MVTLLVDGSHLARRNYHGQNLRTTTGTRTGMVYGFINSLLFVQRRIDANRIYVVWDVPGGSNFRKELYPQYKANRNAAEPDYLEDLEMLRTVLGALGVAQLYPQHGECDDAIGYMCETLEGDKYIFSGDKDFYQLYGDNVYLLNTEGEQVICDDDGRLLLREGPRCILLRPDQIVSYKALRGDTADNIPGVPRFGISAAVKYFNRNNNLEDFMEGRADLSELAQQHIRNMLAARSLLPVYEQLATINPERGRVEYPSERPAVNWSKALKLFEYLEFKVYTSMGEEILIIGGDSVWP